MMFCNDKIYSESSAVWRNLLDKHEIVQEILELRRTNSIPALQLFNSMVTAHLEKSDEPIHSLLLLIVLTKKIVELSLGPTENFKVILNHCEIIANHPNSSNIILILLAEILQSTSIVHVPKIIAILDNLITKKKLGHALIQHMILDGLIQVLALPSFSNGKLGGIERLMNYIRNKKTQPTIVTSSFVSPFINMSPELMNARDVAIMLETRPSLQFEKISSNYAKWFWTRNHLVLRGFCHSGEALELEIWKRVLKTLIEISKADDEFKTSLVMPLLFKLSNSTSPKMKLAILQNMIQLGATTEIFGAIKALSKDMLRSMSIDLHLRLWKVEPRTYPFLHQVLIEKSSTDDDDFGLEIVRAAAIKEICDLRPQHGSDLVSIISEILNNSLELKEGDIPASLSIDSITLLCQNHIINVVSTWKAISFTTKYEKRPRVIKSLCNFFAIIPSLKRTSVEYENMMKEVVARLWHMIQFSDQYGIKCAAQALKSWRYDTLTLDMIPAAFREGIAIPETPEGMEVSILDLEVPGECFIQLLTKAYPSGLQTAGDLLRHYVECEIAEFRSGHYLVKEGHPEPMSYKKLPKQSILKALVHFIINQATTSHFHKLAEEAIIVEALRVLAAPYNRPLPPLNWCFLHDMLHKGQNIKLECLRIAAKQAIISGTAKRLIENFLMGIEENTEDDVNLALDTLVDLCNGVSPEVFQTFCELTLKTRYETTNECVKKCLRNEKRVTNRENLALMTSIYLGNNEAPIGVIQLIPPKILDAVSFQLDQRQKIKYRCEILKSNSSVDNSVAWLSELVTEQMIQREHRDILIESIVDLLIKSEAFPKKNWLIDSINRIQNRLVEKDLEEETVFLLDVFIVSVVAVSGYSEVLTRDLNKNIISSLLKLFPQSIELVSRQTSFSDINGVIFEFLLHMINRDDINDDIRKAFKTSILISKDNVYFNKPKTWQKFLLKK